MHQTWPKTKHCTKHDLKKKQCTNHNQKQNNAPNTTENKTLHQTWPKTKHCTKHDLHPTQWTMQSCHWRCTNSMLLFTASHSYHRINFFWDVTMCYMASSSQCFQGSQLLNSWDTILWNVTNYLHDFTRQHRKKPA